MFVHRRSLRVLALIVPLFVGACSSDPEDSSTAITVFAASSLTAAFQQIGTAFETAHPDASVTFNFAASSELATQIVEGAPVDVFASADQKNMTRVSDADALSGMPAVFATNSMSIIVGVGNPKGITSLADLADPDLLVVLCAPEVPCGRYADRLLTDAGVAVTPRSLEENAKAAVSKVVSGEADAAIVFTTDVLAAGDSATGVDIPADQNIVAEYPIAVTSSASTNPDAAAFVEFVLSPAGRAILASHGFGAP